MRRQMLGKSMLEVPVVAAGCMRIQGMDETEVDEYIPVSYTHLTLPTN